MFRTLEKSKTIMMFGTVAIATVMLVFPAGAIIGNQKALAANLAGSGLADPDQGISYPSPLSHWFGGDVIHHHGFQHSGFHHRH